jgi:hypothetical protein
VWASPSWPCRSSSWARRAGRSRSYDPAGDRASRGPVERGRPLARPREGAAGAARGRVGGAAGVLGSPGAGSRGPSSRSLPAGGGASPAEPRRRSERRPGRGRAGRGDPQNRSGAVRGGRRLHRRARGDLRVPARGRGPGAALPRRRRGPVYPRDQPHGYPRFHGGGAPGRRAGGGGGALPDRPAQPADARRPDSALRLRAQPAGDAGSRTALDAPLPGRASAGGGPRRQPRRPSPSWRGRRTGSWSTSTWTS